jgi:hypothetical protein
MMNDDGMTPELAAYVATHGHSDNFRDLSADEVRAMSWAEYCRRTGRDKTPAQMALAAYEAQPETQSAPGATRSTPETRNVSAGDSEPAQGMTEEEMFHKWRAQRVRGGEGQGLFSGLGGSQSDAYRDAAARHTGRTAFGREQHHPGVPRQFPKNEVPPSGRRQFYAG